MVEIVKSRNTGVLGMYVDGSDEVVTLQIAFWALLLRC